MVNETVEGVQGVKLAVHLCRRTGARARGESRFEGGYERILEQINRLRVHHITMEFSDPGSGDMQVLGELRPDFEIGLGCVDVTPGVVDTPEQIAERVRGALAYVSPGRLTLNPDCGFSPGSGAQVGVDEVYAKLRNEVAAARRGFLTRRTGF